jgi:hypothetical protein
MAVLVVTILRVRLGAVAARVGMQVTVLME